jgi:hypothetical protein
MKLASIRLVRLCCSGSSARKVSVEEVRATTGVTGSMA